MRPRRVRIRAAPHAFGTVLALALSTGSSAPVSVSATPTPPPARWTVPGVPPTSGTTGDPDEHVAGTEAVRLVGLVSAAHDWTSVATAPSAVLASPSSFPATSALVDSALLWTARGSWEQALAWVQGHPPLGASGVDGSGTMSRYGVVDESDVSYAFPVSSGAIQSEQVSVAVAPLPGGGAGIRAVAQVIWYPTRPSRESVPAGDHFATVEVSAGSSADSEPSVVALRALHDPEVVSELAGKIDALPLQVPGARSCPGGFASAPRLTLAFTGAGPGKPEVKVVDDTSGCGEVRFSIGGRQQPSLVDDGLFHLADSLIGISVPDIDPAG